MHSTIAQQNRTARARARQHACTCTAARVHTTSQHTQQHNSTAACTAVYIHSSARRSYIARQHTAQHAQHGSTVHTTARHAQHSSRNSTAQWHAAPQLRIRTSPHAYVHMCMHITGASRVQFRAPFSGPATSQPMHMHISMHMYSMAHAYAYAARHVYVHQHRSIRTSSYQQAGRTASSNHDQQRSRTGLQQHSSTAAE